MSSTVVSPVRLRERPALPALSLEVLTQILPREEGGKGGRRSAIEPKNHPSRERYVRDAADRLVQRSPDVARRSPIWTLTGVISAFLLLFFAIGCTGEIIAPEDPRYDELCVIYITPEQALDKTVGELIDEFASRDQLLQCRPVKILILP